MGQERSSSAPWCDDDSRSLAAKLSVLTHQLQNHPDLGNFTRRAAVMTVVDTLKYEKTWPDIASEEDLQQVLYEIWDGAAAGDPNVKWEAEGECTTTEEARKQVSQTMLALKYLWDLPLKHMLTEENIKVAHGILMADAISEGELMNAGTYRTKPSHAPGSLGGIDFLPPEQIVSSMEKLVADLAKKKIFSARTAAIFCYRFLIIHPFSNGNGRLVRLLVAWIMRSAGMPFPISIGQGKDARKRWMSALKRNDSQRGLGWLEILILESSLNRWINFSLQVNNQLEDKYSSGCSYLDLYSSCIPPKVGVVKKFLSCCLHMRPASG